MKTNIQKHLYPPPSLKIAPHKHFGQTGQVGHQKAFTLAETLITLLIIGVVAVLVIPSMYTNYQKRETVIRLKTIYSRLEQAIRLSATNNEDINIDTWDFEHSNKDNFDKYLLKNINIVSKKTSQNLTTDKIYFYESSGKIEKDLWVVRSPVDIYTISNGTDILLTRTDPHNPNFENIDYINIYVDLNGVNKGPNRLGRDFFNLELSKSHGLYFNGTYNNDEITFANEPNIDRDVLLGKKNPKSTKSNYNYRYGCNKNSKGFWCGALMKADGWQIKDDYPW